MTVPALPRGSLKFCIASQRDLRSGDKPGQQKDQHHARVEAITEIDVREKRSQRSRSELDPLLPECPLQGPNQAVRAIGVCGAGLDHSSPVPTVEVPLPRDPLEIDVWG